MEMGGGSPEYDPLEADLGEREWGWGSGKQRGMEHIRGQQNTVFPRKQILLQRMPPPARFQTDAVNETGFTSFATHGTLGLL